MSKKGVKMPPTNPDLTPAKLILQNRKIYQKYINIILGLKLENQVLKVKVENL